MYYFVQLLNALQIGAIYSLIALGYTMVYGIVKLINFAHGDILMVSAYLLLYGLEDLGLPLHIVFPSVILISALLGILIERLAYKPLRNSSRLSALITAIGISLLLQNAAMLIFSPNPRRFPSFFKDWNLSLGEFSISYLSLINIAIALLLMILLRYFIAKTKMGKAMRAVSEDSQAAGLMGINVNHTISMTFALGSGLAAVAALMYALAYPQVQPYMGALPGIKAFVAAVLGGIGIIPGAMLGGFILGLTEGMTKTFIPSKFSSLSDAVIFLILVLVLLIKPSGLLGKNQKEKV